MRLDALLPIILILCLLALTYFITKAVQASKLDNSEPPRVELENDYGAGYDAQPSGSANTDLRTSSSGSSAGSGSSSSSEDGYYDTDQGDEDSAPSTDYATRTGSSYQGSNADDGASSGSFSSSSSSTGGGSDAGSTGNYDRSSSGTGSSSSATATSSSGRYLVVAGTYRQKVNAELQVRRLHYAGFANAHTAIFDRGTYALAIADRFSSLSRAEELKRLLAAEGFNSYVKDVR